MKITKYLCLAFSLMLFSCNKIETDGKDNVNEDAISFTASITAVVRYILKAVSRGKTLRSQTAI